MDDRVWRILVESFPKLLEKCVQVTIPLTILSFILALIISVIVAIIQYANVPVAKQLSRFYIWLVRGTPLIVQLYIIFYGLPSVGLLLPGFLSAVLVLGFNEGSYMAESMRAALEAVPKGQMEAGQCIGMTYIQIMRRIILPQAFRTAFPSLSNSLISLTKGTSLAATITVTEMFRQGQMINGRYYESMAIYCEVAVFYLVICSVLTFIQHLGEKKLNSYGGVR